MKPKHQDPRYPEEWSQEILAEAMKLYAAYRQQITMADLISAGDEADIPPQFIRQATDIVANRKNQRKWVFNFVLVLVASLLVGGVIGIIFSKNSINSNPTTSLPSSTLESSSGFPNGENIHYVYKIKEVNKNIQPLKRFGISDQIDDNNLVAETVVYKEGKTGFTETLYCVFPPETNINSLIIIEFQERSSGSELQQSTDFIGIAKEGSEIRQVYYCRIP